jgi:hypothetical protein
MEDEWIVPLDCARRNVAYEFGKPDMPSPETNAAFLKNFHRPPLLYLGGGRTLVDEQQSEAMEPVPSNFLKRLAETL